MKKKAVKQKEVIAPSLYNLDMYEALRAVIEKGAVVKGEKFADGVYMKKSSDMVCLMNINRLTTGQHFFIASKGYANQKYRVVSSVTNKGLKD